MRLNAAKLIFSLIKYPVSLRHVYLLESDFLACASLPQPV
jgi:hypothetical protein